MSRITDVQIIERFTSDLNGNVHGLYWARYKGDKKLFVENGDTIAVVSHFLGESADKCLNIINDDVAKELRQAILELL
jgi:hypothetical protein